jgi:A/G-specific adenine glycosylase
MFSLISRTFSTPQMKKSNKENLHHYFVKKLLLWQKTINRPMPWKGEKNPYLIWLSEIILQQTRVEQGLPYFLRFKEKYPTITHLANAPEDEVMRLWQGLGYYSRARNLHATAMMVRDKFNGIFPANYTEVLSLKGVGEYTAAAIVSFAYEMPYPVLDGNVYRVLSRFFGIKTAIDNPKAKKEFTTLAATLIQEVKKPSVYNQAIMDFGALQCKPATPDCKNCVLKDNCYAFNNNVVETLPLKEKKIKVKERFFHYLVIKQEDTVYIRKRPAGDIWHNLYEFPLIEATKPLLSNEITAQETWKSIFGSLKIKVAPLPVSSTQKLTHQKINARFFEITLPNDKLYLSLIEKNMIAVEVKKLNNFAFPKIIDWYIQNKQLNLISNR